MESAVTNPGSSTDSGGPSHHARRPMNAFLIFCKRHRSVVREKYPHLENRAVTKILGEWWANLEPDEKASYTELATQYKEAFLRANPDFKWYKLPAPPLRMLNTRPNNLKPQKLTCGSITPGKLADETQLGGLSSLLGPTSSNGTACGEGVRGDLVKGAFSSPDKSSPTKVGDDEAETALCAIDLPAASASQATLKENGQDLVESLAQEDCASSVTSNVRKRSHPEPVCIPAGGSENGASGLPVGQDDSSESPPSTPTTPNAPRPPKKRYLQQALAASIQDCSDSEGALMLVESESNVDSSQEGHDVAISNAAVSDATVPCNLEKSAAALSVESRETMLKASQQQLIDRVVDKLCFLEAALEGSEVEATAEVENEAETGVATTTETQPETSSPVSKSESPQVKAEGEDYIDLEKSDEETSEESKAKVGPKEENAEECPKSMVQRKICPNDQRDDMKSEESNSAAQPGVVEEVVGRWSHTSYYDLPGVKVEEDDANILDRSAIKTEDVSSNTCSAVTSKSSLVTYSLVPSVPDEVAPISNGTGTRTKESTSPVKSQCVINTPQDVCHEQGVSNVVSSPNCSVNLAAGMEVVDDEEEDEELEYCSEEVSASASLLRLSENVLFGAAALRADSKDQPAVALKCQKIALNDDAEPADASLHTDARRSSSRACKGQRYRKFMMEGGLARGRRGRKGLERGDDAASGPMTSSNSMKIRRESHYLNRRSAQIVLSDLKGIARERLMVPSVCAMLRSELELIGDADDASIATENTHADACGEAYADTYADVYADGVSADLLVGPKSPVGAFLLPESKLPAEASSHGIMTPAFPKVCTSQPHVDNEVVATTNCPAMVIENQLTEEVVTAVIVADDPAAVRNNLILPIQSPLCLPLEPLTLQTNHESGLPRVNAVSYSGIQLSGHPSSRSKPVKILKKKKKKTVTRPTMSDGFDVVSNISQLKASDMPTQDIPSRDFNLEERIGALPALSLEQFQQRKRARKKRPHDAVSTNHDRSRSHPSLAKLCRKPKHSFEYSSKFHEGKMFVHRPSAFDRHSGGFHSDGLNGCEANNNDTHPHDGHSSLGTHVHAAKLKMKSSDLWNTEMWLFKENHVHKKSKVISRTRATESAESRDDAKGVTNHNNNSTSAANNNIIRKDGLNASASLVGSQKRKARKQTITRRAPGSEASRKDIAVLEPSMICDSFGLATLAEVAAAELHL